MPTNNDFARNMACIEYSKYGKKVFNVVKLKLER